MHMRNIGKSGLKVSAIGLGCNNFGLNTDAAASAQLINQALDAGVTLFDTAPIYGSSWGESETILGAGLGARRQDAVIVTKFGMTPDYTVRDSSRSGLIEQVELSMQRLRTDYIDVYMLHWPDPNTAPEETLRALDDLITSGKVRYIACGNLPAWKIVEAQWLSKTDKLHKYIVTQDEYSLINQSAKQNLIPALEQYGMGLMPYSPLANGLLTGKYTLKGEQPTDTRLANNLWNTGKRFLTEERLQLVDKLAAFASEHDHTLLELAVSWLLAQPVVCSVIAGVTKTEQLQQNLAAANWQLTPEQMQQVDAICHGR